MKPTYFDPAQPNPATDLDIAATEIPPLVRAAGVVLLGAGALALLIGVQALTGFHVSGLYTLLLVALMAVGAAAATSGWAFMRARAWAAVGALVAAPLLFVMSCIWLLLSIAGGLLSLFALVAPPIALGAIVAAAVASGALRRVSDARAQLRAQGMDLGL